MKKTLVAGVLALSTITLVAGCGANTTGSNASNTTNAQSVSNDMKKQFVSVTAAAQTAIDDFTTGTSMLGTMTTEKIDGTNYAVVATSKSGLEDLEKTYLDFLTQAQVDNLFSHVTLQNGNYVYQPQPSSGDTNDWYNATVTKVTAKDSGYEVTLHVPQTNGGTAATVSAILQKDSSGHWVYAGA